MTQLETVIVTVAPYVTTSAFSFALMTAIELLVKRGPQPLGTRLHGLMFWALWLPVSALIYNGFHLLWAWIGIQPLITLPLEFSWLGAVAVVATPVAAAAIYDFFFYWCHRAEHRWLWRFHAVHHAIRDLNAVNAYHHITEPLFQTVLILLPASLIVSQTGAIAPFMVVVIYLQTSFIHSASALHFGPGRVLFVDNRFHRIHHSLEERHFDKNFGAFTTLWDRLFGTAHFPASDEWPDVGLTDIDQPRSLGQWLSLPWRYGREAKATAASVTKSLETPA